MHFGPPNKSGNADTKSLFCRPALLFLTELKQIPNDYSVSHLSISLLQLATFWCGIDPWEISLSIFDSFHYMRLNFCKIGAFYDSLKKILIISALKKNFIITVSTQIERRRSNFRPRFFGAFVFKFEPNLTVLIKYLPQKVDFC